jgi:hypothetical protein
MVEFIHNFIILRLNQTSNLYMIFTNEVSAIHKMQNKK